MAYKNGISIVNPTPATRDDLIFDRWEDFATRMALAAWPNATEKRKALITRGVRDFLAIVRSEERDVTDWDGSDGGTCVCDRMEEFIDDRGLYHENFDKYHRFATQLKCCIRAGLDVASRRSAGVIGFDVAMLRRMYDSDVPAWVSEWFDPPLQSDTSDTEPIWL